MIGEEGVGPAPERCGGFLAFIGEDLRVRQPRVVINRVMQVGIAPAPLLVVAVAGRSPQLAVSTTVGDAAQLLDVDMD